LNLESLLASELSVSRAGTHGGIWRRLVILAGFSGSGKYRIVCICHHKLPVCLLLASNPIAPRSSASSNKREPLRSELAISGTGALSTGDFLICSFVGNQNVVSSHMNETICANRAQK